MSIYLQQSASIQPKTSSPKFLKRAIVLTNTLPGFLSIYRPGTEATHHHAVVSPWAKPEHKEQLAKEATGDDKREKEAEKKKQARAPISSRRHIGDGIVAGRGGGGNHLERARQAGMIRN